MHKRMREIGTFSQGMYQKVEQTEEQGFCFVSVLEVLPVTEITFICCCWHLESGTSVLSHKVLEVIMILGLLP